MERHISSTFPPCKGKYMSHDFTFNSLPFNVLSKNTSAAFSREKSAEPVAVLIGLIRSSSLSGNRLIKFDPF